MSHFAHGAHDRNQNPAHGQQAEFFRDIVLSITPEYRQAVPECAGRAAQE